MGPGLENAGLTLLGGVLAVGSAATLSRWELRRQQRMRIYLELLPAIEEQLRPLEHRYAKSDVYGTTASLAEPAIDLRRVAIIAGRSDKRRALEIFNEVLAIQALNPWQMTNTVSDDMAHSAASQQQPHVDRLRQFLVAYVRHLEDRFD